jgi:uncharacterized membrane protein
MQNVAIIVTLLILPYWLLMLAHAPEGLRGRIGVSLVLVFAALGHFIKTSAMTQMLPSWVPMRTPMIYLTGIFEGLLAIAILATPSFRSTCWLLCIYLLSIVPSNVYAAFHGLILEATRQVQFIFSFAFHCNFSLSAGFIGLLSDQAIPCRSWS